VKTSLPQTGDYFVLKQLQKKSVTRETLTLGECRNRKVDFNNEWEKKLHATRGRRAVVKRVALSFAFARVIGENELRDTFKGGC